LAATLLAQATAPAQGPTADGIVAGRVVDGSSPKRSWTMRAASSFTGLAPGTYEFLASRRGFTSGEFGKLRPDGARVTFALAEHERRTDVVLRVWKNASIAGVVLDDTSEPVVGVSVFGLRRDWVAGETRLVNVGSATTDGRGMYRMSGLLPGDYLVGVPSTRNTLPVTVLDAYAMPPVPALSDIRTAVTQVAGSPMPLGSRENQRVGDLVLHGSSPSPVAPDPAPDGRLTVFAPAYFPSAPGGADSGVVTVGSGEAKSLPQAIDGFAAEFGFETARTMTDGTGTFTFLGVTAGAYRLRAFSSVSSSSFGPGAPVAVQPPSSAAPLPSFWLTETVVVGTDDVALTLSAKPTFSVRGRR
jgi:hypothetical protein